MAKKAKVPYAGKEKRNGKKLPVPPPKPAQQAASPVNKTAMPLTGKAALRAIADAAVKDVPVTKVPDGAKGPVKNGKPGPDAKTQPERRAVVKAMLADPKKDGIPPALQVQNRKPLSPEVKRNVDALCAKAQSVSAQGKDAAYRAAQKQTKAEMAKAKRAVKKAKSERQA